MAPAGLYLHVPFCARACPYCDFDFEVGRRPQLDAAIDSWFAGLATEWSRRGLTGEFDTVYVGGGTPSALGPEGLARLFAWLGHAGVDVGRTRETTVELNPEHVDEPLLGALVDAGVQRVSLGVQSLDAVGLRELGRAHDVTVGRSSVAASVGAGLRVSADLIVGWRGHDEGILRREVDELLSAGVEHVSVYALTIEPETPWLELVRRGLRVLPDDDRQAELLLAAEAELTGAGLVHYEVASYAVAGAEAIHNGKYWRWSDVVGLGPSAASVHHGPGTVDRLGNPRGLAAWRSGEAPTHERLAGERAAAEGLWLGLRRLPGLDVGVYQRRFGVDDHWLGARIARQIALGNLEWFERPDGARCLRVAGDRWLFHDTIAADLL